MNTLLLTILTIILLVALIIAFSQPKVPKCTNMSGHNWMLLGSDTNTKDELVEEYFCSDRKCGETKEITYHKNGKETVKYL